MASIRTSIELYDAISAPLAHITNALNMTISSFKDMHSTANESFDASSLESAREQANQATIAIDRLSESMDEVVQPDVGVPTAPVQEPVEVPIRWQSENMDVFTNTGIDRFQQEVQSANNMLNTLNNTQEQIARQAANTDIFPDNMIADLNGMGGRIQRISSQIQQIESNPMNLGTDLANSQLEQLRMQLSQAVGEQEDLNQAVQRMDVGEANQAYMRLSQTVGGTESYIRDNVDAQGQFNNQIRDGTDAVSGLERKLLGVVAAYASLQGVQKLLNLSDTATLAEARLNLIVDDGGSVDELQNKIFASAQDSRALYGDTAAAISKMGMNAGNAFSGNDELIAFMGQVNKQFVIGGASATEQSSAIMQLTQAMAAGALRGEELNSILDGAPGIARSIEESMGWAEGSIKSYAEQGLVTATVVKNALLSTADATNAAFESIPMTFGQAVNSIKNNALFAFDPVLEKLNEIANSERFNTMAADLSGTFVLLSNIAVGTLDTITQAGAFLADNWSIIAPLIYGLATAFGIYTAALVAYNIVQGITNGIKGIAALKASVHAAGLMLETGATFAATVAQHGLNAALLACPITWIIIGIIAIIAIIYMAVAAFNKFAGTSASATGIIVGVLAAAAAFIGNLFVTLINLIIDIVGIVWNHIAAFAEFFANVFNNPIGSIVRLFAGMADTVLGILEGIASAIDTLFGSNLAGAVSGWRSSLSDMVTDLVGDAEIKVPRVDTSAMKLDRFEYGEAYNAGYSIGEGIEDTISNFDIGSLFDMPDPSNNGNNSYESGYDAASVPDPSDYASGYDASSVPGNIADTANNTGAIKDSVDISQEDLKYMRDLAEMEVVNRFTTAEIKVDMVNNNTINNEMDLDGVVSYLGEGVNEAMEKAAEGVHA